MYANGDERNVLTAVAAAEKWNVQYVESCELAWASARTLAAPVILLDRDWPGIEWRVAIETLAYSPHRPCVILTSTVSDDYLWEEVARLGGYDVLTKPLAAADLVRVVRLALTFWRNMATVISSNEKPSLEERSRMAGVNDCSSPSGSRNEVPGKGCRIKLS